MAMTLDDLRQQFERADEAYHHASATLLMSPGKSFAALMAWRMYEKCPDACVSYWDREIVEKPILFRNLMKHLPVEDLLLAARTYIIARDFGLQAAMTYKLSDGCMDPRKP